MEREGFRLRSPARRTFPTKSRDDLSCLVFSRPDLFHSANAMGSLQLDNNYRDACKFPDSGDLKIISGGGLVLVRVDLFQK